MYKSSAGLLVAHYKRRIAGHFSLFLASSCYVETAPSASRG